MKVFGPAIILHNGVNLGKTHKGGSYNITSITKRKAGPIPEYDSIVVGGNGTIRMFELASQIVITETMLYRDWGTLILTMPFLTLTFHKAKIFYPSKLELGTNAQASLDLDFQFVPAADGKVVTLT